MSVLGVQPYHPAPKGVEERLDNTRLGATNRRVPQALTLSASPKRGHPPILQ